MVLKIAYSSQQCFDWNKKNLYFWVWKGKYLSNFYIFSSFAISSVKFIYEKYFHKVWKAVKDGSIGSTSACGSSDPSSNPGEGEFILNKKD